MPWATRWPNTDSLAATASTWNQLKSPDRPQKLTTSVSVIVRPDETATSPSVRSSHSRRSSATSASLARFRPGSLEVLHPLADAVQPLLEDVVGAGVGEADVALAAVAEGRAGDHAHLVVLDHVVGELLGGHARAAD